MLWDGHTDDPISGWQPKAGWEPHAAFFFTDPDANGAGDLKLHQHKAFFDILDKTPYSMQQGATYNVTMRVEQTDVLDRSYSLKFWESGTPEPTAWTSQGIETFDQPVTGSFVVNAHYFDVTFGDVNVTQIPGDDILKGTDGDDLLLAADTGDLFPGLGEIDVLEGGAGADTFVLGGNGTVYYDDGDATSEGVLDYALLWDFATGVDTIRLGGTSADYAVAAAPTGLHDGTAIYHVNDAGGPDDLIAIAHNVTALSLTSDDVEYDPFVA
jgi:Ca2+-binding RTX toxin-like protein